MCLAFFSVKTTKTALAADCCSTCNSFTALCAPTACGCTSIAEAANDIPHITRELENHQRWFIQDVWDETVLNSMLKITQQINVSTMKQVAVIGSFFDAKHQLETQRLFQELMADSHKDYHPSEGMCQFGTVARSLAAANRNAEFNQIAVASRALQRQTLSGIGISSESEKSDSISRLIQFTNIYCNPNDNGFGLELLCNGGEKGRRNKDLSFFQTIDANLTIDVDFVPGDHPNASPDEEDVLALGANLYSHKILPQLPADLLFIDPQDEETTAGGILYMKGRALAAKRGVAEAAYSAQAGMRALGEPEVQPYIVAILIEMGIPEEAAIGMIGNRPSYHAQMDLLTKKIYQDPKFFTELYDKPTNVDRKRVSMDAIGLMQKRDIYRSQLRSEAIMSVWLESTLEDLQAYYTNEADKAVDEGRVIVLP